MEWRMFAIMGRRQLGWMQKETVKSQNVGGWRLGKVKAGRGLRPTLSEREPMSNEVGSGQPNPMTFFLAAHQAPATKFYSDEH